MDGQCKWRSQRSKSGNNLFCKVVALHIYLHSKRHASDERVPPSSYSECEDARSSSTKMTAPRVIGYRTYVYSSSAMMRSGIGYCTTATTLWDITFLLRSCLAKMTYGDLNAAKEIHLAGRESRLRFFLSTPSLPK